MPDLTTATYFVTEDKVQEGQHILHSERCQVLPENGLRDLGQHKGSAPAMEKARADLDPVNGCAFCCPDSYTGSEAFETGRGGLTA